MNHRWLENIKGVTLVAMTYSCVIFFENPVVPADTSINIYVYTHNF
jgi:hypothetical protein